MEVLDVARVGAVVAALALGACYDPSLRDCTISCTGANDCAGDQVCGTDGLCASAANAGHCAELLAADARGAGPDARPGKPDAMVVAHPDAHVDAMPDADLHGTIHVVIASRGRVTTQPASTPPKCESPDDHGIACDLVAAPGPTTLHQMTTHGGDKFVGWSDACSGGGGDCHVVVVTGLTVTVGAEFMEGK